VYYFCLYFFLILFIYFSEEKEKKTAASQFGSMTVNLVDGMVLSLSQYGPNGEIPEGGNFIR
jgi:hypothetical protein